MQSVADFAPIVAERLLLRPFVVEEARVIVAYRRDPAVARFQGWGVVDPGEIERDLEAMRTRTPCDVPGPWFQLAVVSRATRGIVGDVGEDAHAHQGQGYGTEAVSALCDWLLGPRALARVIAVVDGRNAPSIAVAENAGFHRIALVETRHTGAPTALLTYERRQSRAVP